MKKLQISHIIKITLPILSVVTILFLVSTIVNATSRSVDGKLDKRSGEVAESIQVNILNACGEDGLASKARKYLRKRGFDVVEIGNYPGLLKKSIVIDRLGDRRSALKTAYAFGVNDSLVYKNIDSTLFVRNTLIIGKDYNNLNAFQ